MVPGRHSIKAIMDHEGRGHVLLPHSCCVWINRYPSTLIYSEMICSMSLQPSAGMHVSPVTDATAVLVDIPLFSLLCRAHWWQQSLSRLGCTDRLVDSAWYSRAYLGVNIRPGPIACLSPFFPSQRHLRASQSGNQIIPWTRHAESMATPLTASLCSMCILFLGL